MTEDNEINFEQILNLIKSFSLNNVMIFYFNPEKNMYVFYSKYKIIIKLDTMNKKRSSLLKDTFGNRMLIRFTP